jgi:hypothetical protein
MHGTLTHMLEDHRVLYSRFKTPQDYVPNPSMRDGGLTRAWGELGPSGGLGHQGPLQPLIPLLSIAHR